MIYFNEWFTEAYNDVFGFETTPKHDKDTQDKEKDSIKPILPFRLDVLSDYLVQFHVGPLMPEIHFVNEMQWGKGSGSLRLTVGQWYNMQIDRMGIDLQGSPLWYTKKMMQIRNIAFAEKEEQIGDSILEELNKIHNLDPDSPVPEYDKLEELTYSMSDRFRQVASKIFTYKGIRKIDQDNYIIRLIVSNQGLEAPDHHRVIENQTHLSYKPERGAIRILNYNIESPTRTHNWEIMPSDLDVYVFPTQPVEEIVELIAVSLKFY